MNHAGSWSLYVPDPEGNTIELFVRTDWYVPPHATTGVDLSESEEVIMQQTELMAEQTSGSKIWDIWLQDFQKRMDCRACGPSLWSRRELKSNQERVAR